MKKKKVTHCFYHPFVKTDNECYVCELERRIAELELGRGVHLSRIEHIELWENGHIKIFDELRNRIEALEDVLNKTVLPEPMPRIEPEKPKPVEEVKESELLNILNRYPQYGLAKYNIVEQIRQLTIEKVSEAYVKNKDGLLYRFYDEAIKKLEEM